MSLLLYNLLLPFALLAMLPSALRKMTRRGGCWRDLWQRLGVFDAPERAALAAISRHERRYWFHAVSVGEVGVALKMLAPLLARDPETAVVLTVTTPTGHQLARAFADRHPGRMALLYSPVDFPWVVRPMLREIAPRRLVLVEAEVWPNLVSAAHRLGIPVTLANTRLSARSERRFRRFDGFTRPLFAKLDQVLVQEAADVTRWAELGADPRGVHLTGSVKYDPQNAEVPAATLEAFKTLLSQIGIARGRQKIIIAASTHAGEERALAAIHHALAAEHGGLALLIVPRHVERCAEIERELAELGLTPLRRSTLRADSPARPFDSSRPLLIDTTGELAAWQHLSDIAIIGKSFLAEGGQNPAEAALAGKPVVFGPHMENFGPLVALLLQAGGATQVSGLKELPETLRRLLSDPALAARMGTAGQAALARHRGATDLTLRWLTS